MRLSLLRIGLLLLAICTFGQAPNVVHSTRLDEVKQRIVELERSIEALNSLTVGEKSLGAVCATKGCDQASTELREQSRTDGLKRVKAVNSVLSQIQKEIDAEIARTANLARIRRTVKALLDGVSDDDGPTVLLPGISRGRKSLVVAYGLRRGVTRNSNPTFTLRTYWLNAGRFQLAGATDGDMNAYQGVELKELPSPVPNEEWFLLTGQASGANGPNTRMRVYAFDGKTYRLRWMPENVWGWFTTRVDNSGFRVDGPYYREPGVRHDLYHVTTDGLYRWRQRAR